MGTLYVPDVEGQIIRVITFRYIKHVIQLQLFYMLPE